MTKPYHEMSEQEKLAFGQEVAEDPTCHNMERQGGTNGHAAHH